MTDVLKKIIHWMLISTIVFGTTSLQAKTYRWQNISFNYHAPSWSLLTDRVIGGKKLIHMHYKTEDGYPISILLGLIPKTSNRLGFLKVRKGRSANMIATQFAWPMLKRFTHASSISKRLVSFNEISVSQTLSPGSLIMMPTPQKNIFISAQTFYLDAKGHYIMGSIITRVDKGTMRRSLEYTSRINQAYQLISNIQI